jgi:hypothetical protein
MNTFTLFYGILVILIFVVSSFISMPMQAQTIQIDSLFTSDGEIFPFSQNDTISGIYHVSLYVNDQLKAKAKLIIQ